MNRFFLLFISAPAVSTNCSMTTWSVNATTIAGFEKDFQTNSSTSLYYPVDITVDENNNVYVLDSLIFRVQRFTPGSTIGTTVLNGSMDGSPAWSSNSK